MGKLRIFSGSQICKILQAYGFVMVRQKGSHVIMQKSENGTTITVPVPQHNPVKMGTLLSIIRQSQLSKTLFEV